MKFTIEKTSLFYDWYDSLNVKIQSQVAARFSRIQISGHFGDSKPVGDGVFELKWKSGLRVYYAYLEKSNILVLLGGNKNGQKEDIKKSKKLISI